MLGERKFQAPGSATGASPGQNLVAGLLEGWQQLADDFMIFKSGADILKPYLADMRGKTGAQDITQIVDCLGRLQLPQSKQRSPRCLAFAGRCMFALLAPGGGCDLFKRIEKLAGPLMPLPYQSIISGWFEG